jgi:ethanolamine utilization protein EutM
LYALGLIETLGYSTAVSAADAAVKSANVEIIGIEKVIGVSGYLGVTIHLSGDVGAVIAAVEAGKEEGERVGKVISADVIARAHSDVQNKLIKQFAINEKDSKSTSRNTKGKTKDKISKEETSNKEDKQE